MDFSEGGFDADDLWRKLSVINPLDAIVTYGSGLENQPELLEKISRHFSLLGNTPDVVARIKDPRRFFSLLDKLDIAYPDTRLNEPAEMAGWLVKETGGSGGTHIRLWDGVPGGYYQRQMDGLPASVLFLADGKNIEVVGYNEQWLAPVPGKPFRYGGAVGNANFSSDIKASMVEAARKVVVATSLRGLNSMDFLLMPERALVLEVNPRLSASFALYDTPNLFERHLQACRGKLMPLSERAAGSKAHLIYYTSYDVVATDGVKWPEWTADLPPAGTMCKAGEPVCTVLAQAHDARGAKELAFARAHQINAQLQPYFE